MGATDETSGASCEPRYSKHRRLVRSAERRSHWAAQHDGDAPIRVAGAQEIEASAPSWRSTPGSSAALRAPMHARPRGPSRSPTTWRHSGALDHDYRTASSEALSPSAIGDPASASAPPASVGSLAPSRHYHAPRMQQARANGRSADARAAGRVRGRGRGLGRALTGGSVEASALAALRGPLFDRRRLRIAGRLALVGW